MQIALFPDATPTLPPGAVLVPDFLTEADERQLLAIIRTLALTQARYKQYTARRRIASFGSQFDYDDNVLRRAEPVPEALLPLRERVAGWLATPPERLAQMLVSEYAPGTPLGWHRDVPEFESIVGISLQGMARMKLRPYPPDPAAQVIQVDLPPRSIYVLEGPARWAWQHCIVETRMLRYSVTLRTAKGSPPLLANGRAG